MTQRIEELIAFVNKHMSEEIADDRCILLMKDGEPWYMEDHDHAIGWMDKSLDFDKVKEISEDPEKYGYLVTSIDYCDIEEYVQYHYRTQRMS